MGFSVSGAAAVIFASLFIAFGMWYTAVDNSFNQVSDAQSDQIAGTLDASNTDFEIAAATFNESGDEELEIRVNNTGATTIALSKADLLIDGEYEPDWQSFATVDGNAETDLWLPGEQLVIERDIEQPDRVKLVTDTAVADSADVESTMIGGETNGI